MPGATLIPFPPYVITIAKRHMAAILPIFRSMVPPSIGMLFGVPKATRYRFKAITVHGGTFRKTHVITTTSGQMTWMIAPIITGA